MRRTFALGERVGGLLRGPRAVYAVAPLFIPLIFASVNTAPAPATKSVNPEAILPIRYDAPPTPEVLPPHPVCLRIASGDTLETIFADGGMERSEAVLLAREFSKSVDPRKLKVGEPVRFFHNTSGAVERVAMKITGWGNVEALRDGGQFVVRADAASERSERVVVDATVDSSLYEAIRGSGETPQLVASLVDVFQWDVDFFRLRNGDSFKLIVEKKFVGEDHVGYGPILAAQFVHNGQMYEAYRFDNGATSGYYGRNGSPLRKQFLRAPLKYSRITSGFTKRRFHPVLNRFRPHYGVDYGAPTGTPVMTTADGVVMFAGFDRGEGNYIRVRHNSRIETSYLHLSRFASGIKRGARVKQGDVIGFVGSTGLSTGPHLDYRVSDGGKWMNPQQLKSITADPLSGNALKQFKVSVANHLERFTHNTGTAVASAGKSRPALF